MVIIVIMIMVVMALMTVLRMTVNYADYNKLKKELLSFLVITM